jgi:hypothetical protein
MWELLRLTTLRASTACGRDSFTFLPLFHSRQAYMFPAFLCGYYFSGGLMSLIRGFISKLILNGRDVLVIHNTSSWGETSCTEQSYHVFFTRATTLCAGLGLLHGFVTVNFSGVGSLVLRSTSNLEGQGRQFVWPLLFYLPGMRVTTRSLHCLQRSSLNHGGA